MALPLLDKNLSFWVLLRSGTATTMKEFHSRTNQVYRKGLVFRDDKFHFGINACGTDINLRWINHDEVVEWHRQLKDQGVSVKVKHI